MRCLGGAVLLLALSGFPPLHAQEAAFEWSAPLSAGRTLEVRGITGSIRTEFAPGITASVVAEKRGWSGDFEDVEIRAAEDDEGVVICALYGSWNRDRDGCDEDWEDRRSGDRGHHGRIDVEVDFVVRLPQGVELVATMVSGDVEIMDVRSDVTATTVSGDIFVSTSGVAWAHTVSGSINVEMGSMDWEDLEFRTVSGDITLRLPRGLDTEVEFESLSGDLDSDFDIQGGRSARRRLVGTRVRGTIGDGGRHLTFHTVSGDVRLRRAS